MKVKVPVRTLHHILVLSYNYALFCDKKTGATFSRAQYQIHFLLALYRNLYNRYPPVMVQLYAAWYAALTYTAPPFGFFFTVHIQQRLVGKSILPSEEYSEECYESRRAERDGIQQEMYRTEIRTPDQRYLAKSPGSS